MSVVVAVVVVLANAVAADHTNNVSLEITDITSDQINIRLRNISSEPLRIWQESNSWGAARWRVIVLRGEQMITLFQNPEQFFTKNSPGYNELGRGGIVERKLNLSDGSWRGSIDKEIALQKGDLVVVIYDVPLSHEAQSLGVWYGVAATHVAMK